jgi:endonuclease-3
LAYPADSLGLKGNAKLETMAAKKKTHAKKPRAKKASTRKAKRPVPNPHWKDIDRELRRLYPDADCALVHEDPFQLLVATILSAQCTDVRVNIVTKELFRDYPTPEAFLALTQEELEDAIRSTGFFRNKAKNILAACRALVEEHHGEIPNDMTKLNALAGVGRKTANVVLGNAFDNPGGVVVDTHVKRISNKLGLTEQSDPVKIERDLNALLPRRRWVKFAHQVIHHGRQVCRARSPKCDACTLYEWCYTRA